MPTLEDALAKLTSAKYFSKLDASSGNWQLKLDDKSSYLTTFNTPFGRYRFRRLPFGLISAQDEFQRKMDEVFEGLPGVTPLVDEILISGRTRQDDRKRTLCNTFRLQKISSVRLWTQDHGADRPQTIRKHHEEASWAGTATSTKNATSTTEV